MTRLSSHEPNINMLASTDSDSIPDTVPVTPSTPWLQLPEVFDPVPCADFCAHLAHRMVRREGEQAVVVQLRWIARQLCVTGISLVDASTAREWLGPMQLLIDPPADADRCASHVRLFANETQRLTYASHPRFERVRSGRRDVHLVRPFHESAACGARPAAWGEPTKMPLTCRLCIGLAYRQSLPGTSDLHSVTLSPKELDRLAPRSAREAADRLLGIRHESRPHGN